MVKTNSRIRKRHLAIILDLLMIPIAWYAAYWLRFNLGAIPAHVLTAANHAFFIVFFIQLCFFGVFGLHRGMWRFTSIPDLLRIIKAVILGSIVSLVPLYFSPILIPRSILLLYPWLLISALAGARIAYRWFKNSRYLFSKGKRVLIVGAGAGGESLLRELNKNRAMHYKAVAIVDDDKTKKGSEILGIRVLDNIDSIPKLVGKHNIELVIIAIPSANAETMRKIVDKCEEAEVQFGTIPPLNDIVSGRANIQSVREIALEDLLGRDPVHLNWEQINKTLDNKKILVSGGGGSIGSELCRQIAFLKPKQLIILDNSEYNLYSIDKELRQQFTDLKLITKLVDVADDVAVASIMMQIKPEIIFHAAAYKHVPLLESQIRAAMRNNILGTNNIVKEAVKNSVDTFVLVSTDKAVNPTNIMGATKRAAEMICQHYSEMGDTNFITVRFGNVLGSAGSVVPLFQKQIEEGKNLTVTHPDIMRYFMTIPEASQLILQATSIGAGGEIFVLDMGTPVKISFLAEQMIRLAGKKLGEDIDIEYTGLRPGEKMYEELFYSHERLLPTEHSKILKSHYKDLTGFSVDEILQKIDAAVSENDADILLELLLQLVPEYQSLKDSTD